MLRFPADPVSPQALQLVLLHDLDESESRINSCAIIMEHILSMRLCDNSPLRRNILVADACERICPPIGFKAPPATKVIVAPGSAAVHLSYSLKEKAREGIVIYTAPGL